MVFTSTNTAAAAAALITGTRRATRQHQIAMIPQVYRLLMTVSGATVCRPRNLAARGPTSTSTQLVGESFSWFDVLFPINVTSCVVSAQP